MKKMILSAVAVATLASGVFANSIKEDYDVSKDNVPMWERIVSGGDGGFKALETIGIIAQLKYKKNVDELNATEIEKIMSTDKEYVYLRAFSALSPFVTYAIITVAEIEAQPSEITVQHFRDISATSKVLRTLIHKDKGGSLSDAKWIEMVFSLKKYFKENKYSEDKAIAFIEDYLEKNGDKR